MVVTGARMQKAKKIINVIVTVFVCLIVLLAVLLVGVRVVGLSPYTVLSGSMEPNYHVGSIVYVKEVNAKDILVDDVITYVIEGGTIVTHRVVEKVVEDNIIYFRTKGDANNTKDEAKIYPDNILGKVVGTVPLIGYVAFFIQNPPGSIIAIAFCICLIIVAFLPDLLDKLIPDGKAKDENELKKDKIDSDSAN